jgi:hypothetical protein
MAAKKDDKDPATDMAETAAKTATEAGLSGIGQAAEAGRRQSEQFRQLMGAGSRLYGDLGEVAQDDVGTLMQTSARLAKGMQDVSWEVMHYTQQSLQLGLRTCNDLMTCRTVEDMLNVQRNFVRQSLDSFLAESAKLIEMSSAVTGEAASRGDEMRH